MLMQQQASAKKEDLGGLLEICNDLQHELQRALARADAVSGDFRMLKHDADLR